MHIYRHTQTHTPIRCTNLFPGFRYWNPTIPNSIVNGYQALQEPYVFVTTYANAKLDPNNPKLIHFSIINDVSPRGARGAQCGHISHCEHQASAHNEPGSSPISSSKKRFPSLPPYKSLSQRTLISCELFTYKHHKQTYTRTRERNKSGRSLWAPFRLRGPQLRFHVY